MQDVIIIGCGVVGAACAYRLSRFRLRLTVLEALSDVA
ncbi:MAG: FAD-dependent oxidoreductase, partial [Oscillospiraceae bacterium]|nr:FAD-dependent oxidoreductase [Oscillospiraceae bacterium]